MVCPMPAAETKKALKTMVSGDKMEIIGDFEPACMNVENMAKKNGAEVLEKESKQNYFRVLIRKI
jgi:TusA-related sulfurtransferase